MIDIKNKENCCGCSACSQACPKNCIKMVSDEEGFLYPRVDQTMCINCGLCQKVCPILNAKADTDDITHDVYVGYAKDISDRLNSSSGALFPTIAKKVIEEGGVVFGAVFDSEFMVHHVGIDNNEDLFRLQGSKYLQSRIENTFCEVESHLLQGKKVLFTGTACQIAGLKAYLGKNYSNLFTIDVLCHGTPSPLVWRKYLNEIAQEYNDTVHSVSFRNKKNGWKHYMMRIEFQREVYEKKHSEDEYMKLFLSDICLRPSCHNCLFKKIDRPSDLTLGDSWGIENHSPEMDDDNGTSVIIIHTQSGQKMLDSVKTQLALKKMPLDIVLPASADSRKSVKAHPGRAFFFKYIKHYKVRGSVKYLQYSYKNRIIWKLAKSVNKR